MIVLVPTITPHQPYRSTGQETTNKTKECLMSQSILTPSKALVQRFGTYLIYLISTQYRLSDRVLHSPSNSQAPNMYYFYITYFEINRKGCSCLGDL